MTNLLEVIPRFSIGSEDQVPWVQAEKLVLPGPGVYTLEGPNGSGKSMVVRLLSGTLPDMAARENLPQILVDGTPKKVRSYRDALRAGIVAVAQDDALISSMTVFEYLMLMHGTVKRSHIANYLWTQIYDTAAPTAIQWLNWVEPHVHPRVQAWLETITPRKVDWRRASALRNEAKRLLVEGNFDPGILDEYPTRLSSGEVAAARLIAAQLYKGTRILLLDESFNGVERNVWPRFVDSIKLWAKQSKAAVLAISHNADELARWEPRIRFVIRDRMLSEHRTFPPGTLRLATKSRYVTTPIFEADGDTSSITRVRNGILRELGTCSGITLLHNGLSEECVDQICQYLPQGSVSTTVTRKPISSDWNGDFAGLHNEVDGTAADSDSVVAIAGNSDFLSLMALVASTTAKPWRNRVVFVPVGFADAVSELLPTRRSLQWSVATRDDPDPQLSISYLPRAYLLPVSLYRAQSTIDFKEGLAGCLRLGALFESDLFAQAATALEASAVGVETAMQALRASLSLTNDLRLLDSTGSSFQPLVHIGNDHAALLQLAGLRGGGQLILGMLLELLLAGSDTSAGSLFDQLLKVAKAWPVGFPEQFDEDAYVARATELAKAVPDARVRQSTSTKMRAVRADRLAEFNLSGLREELSAPGADHHRDLREMVKVKSEIALRYADVFELKSVLPRLNELVRVKA